MKRTDEFDPEMECRPLRELKAAEQEKVAANRAGVHEHLPELVPFIRDLHEAGMIDGWRGVSVKLLAGHPGEVVVHASTGSARTDIFKGDGHGTA